MEWCDVLTYRDKSRKPSQILGHGQRFRIRLAYSPSRKRHDLRDAVIICQQIDLTSFISAEKKGVKLQVVEWIIIF